MRTPKIGYIPFSYYVNPLFDTSLNKYYARNKGRHKRGPIKGGQTRTVESLIRRLEAQGIK